MLFLRDGFGLATVGALSSPLRLLPTRASPPAPCPCLRRRRAAFGSVEAWSPRLLAATAAMATAALATSAGRRSIASAARPDASHAADGSCRIGGAFDPR